MKAPLKTYNGGKNGSGVYHALINLIPPHKMFISAFLGNCGVLANIKPAQYVVGVDKDVSIIEAWQKKYPKYQYVCGDAITFLKGINYPALNEGAFIFLDPPYLDEVRVNKTNYYKHEMRDRSDHAKLCVLISSIPKHINIMLIHYPCKFYDQKLKSWRKVDIQGRTRKGMITERVYMNYPEPDQLHDYKFYGQGWRERQKFNRIRLNLVKKLNRFTALEKNYFFNTLLETFPKP